MFFASFGFCVGFGFVFFLVARLTPAETFAARFVAAAAAAAAASSTRQILTQFVAKFSGFSWLPGGLVNGLVRERFAVA